MSALATPSPVSPKDARRLTPRKRKNGVAPIVAAIDGSTAGWHATDAAVRLALELNAPLTFVYVRSGPAGFFGTPVFERRLTTKMLEARRVIDLALLGAARSGIEAEGEILEGSPRKRIVQFASDRSAQLIVIGSRRRRLGRSVSRAVVRAARRPVLVTRGAEGPADAQALTTTSATSPTATIESICSSDTYEGDRETGRGSQGRVRKRKR